MSLSLYWDCSQTWLEQVVKKGAGYEEKLDEFTFLGLDVPFVALVCLLSREKAGKKVDASIRGPFFAFGIKNFSDKNVNLRLQLELRGAKCRTICHSVAEDVLQPNIKHLCCLTKISAEMLVKQFAPFSLHITLTAPESKFSFLRCVTQFPRDFQWLLETGIGTDVTIKQATTDTKVHSVVLMARCPAYRNPTFAQMQHKELEWSQFSVAAATMMLKFIYSGCINVETVDVADRLEFIRLADYLGLYDVAFVYADLIHAAAKQGKLSNDDRSLLNRVAQAMMAYDPNILGPHGQLASVLQTAANQKINVAQE